MELPRAVKGGRWKSVLNFEELYLLRYNVGSVLRLLADSVMQISCLAYFSTLKMSVDFERTTRSYILGEGSLHYYRYENLSSYLHHYD
jgi:hypothetical protein